MKTRSHADGLIGDGEGKTFHVTRNSRACRRDHALVHHPKAGGIELRVPRHPGQSNAETPEKKPQNVAEPSAKKAEGLEQEGHRRRHRHRGQGEEQKGQEQARMWKVRSSAARICMATAATASTPTMEASTAKLLRSFPRR